MNASSIAQSGMNAALLRLDSSAHNIANLPTENFRRQEVVQESVAQGGVKASVKQADVAGSSLVDDVVQQHSASYAFIASLKIIQTEKKMMGTLLDLRV
jgi:flagellar hook-associated protein FlgK